MFSSTNGIPPFSQVSPNMNWYPATSSSSPTSSICLNENPSSTISQHHEDLLAYYPSTHVPPITETTKNNPKTPTPRCRSRRQKSTKKERHSKIFTAQGPRDRRVRLSIDISKKFFGLQDLLGYDKASLTLDWLLTSSKTAIEELLRAKKIDSYDNAMCQLYSSSDAEEDDESRQKNVRKRKRKINSVQKHLNTDAVLIEKIAKERRAQARARARERTRVKSCLRSLLICSQQHKLPDLFDPPRNPASGESTSPPPPPLPLPLPVEAGFIFVNPQTDEVNAHERVKTRPHFYHHTL